jgi:hypothetical protein
MCLGRHPSLQEQCEPVPRQIGYQTVTNYSLTAVAARAIIGIGTSSSSDPDGDEQKSLWYMMKLEGLKNTLQMMFSMAGWWYGSLFQTVLSFCEGK